MEHEVIVVDVRNCSKLLMTFNKCLTRMVKIVSKRNTMQHTVLLMQKENRKKLKRSL